MWKKRSIAKRNFFKTSVVMPAKARLLDLMSEKDLTAWIEGNTRELADDGFVIELDRVMIDGFHIFTDAMKE